MSDLQTLKQEILRLTREYSRKAHASFRPAADPDRQPWQPGSTIPYAGRVFTEEEVEAAVSSTLDFWLTLGHEGEAFQKELASFLGVRNSLLVNSGSSANLVAISTLTSGKLPEERRIKPGDEVITVAAGFPTTVAPIVQVGAVPVFIDADPITGNARCDQLERAYSAGKTKAVMMAHALGNPFDLATTLAFCQKYSLWLVRTTATPWDVPIHCHESGQRASASMRIAPASMKAPTGLSAGLERGATSARRAFTLPITSRWERAVQ